MENSPTQPAYSQIARKTNNFECDLHLHYKPKSECGILTLIFKKEGFQIVPLPTSHNPIVFLQDVSRHIKSAPKISLCHNRGKPRSRRSWQNNKLVAFRRRDKLCPRCEKLQSNGCLLLYPESNKCKNAVGIQEPQKWLVGSADVNTVDRRVVQGAKIQVIVEMMTNQI